MQFSGLEEYPYEKALTLSVFASGSGFEAVNTILTTLRVPELTFFKYQRNQEIIFCELNRAKEEEFIINAKEEYRLAMEGGDHVEVDNSKIPFITVVVDGGWSKRSYRHSFDSKSGVAVIIGARTKKVLWMDIRVKVCAKCSRAKTGNRQADPHRCFKNWEESAQAMEADIIVEGFKKSFSQHGLMYRYVVGDADSSVFYKIKSTCFYPGGIEIQKIDCINHALRCLTTKLHGISKNTTFDKHQRDYVGSKIPQMARDAKGAIDHNSKLLSHPLQLNATPPAKLLFNNLNNIPLHVFGDHSRCDAYFCKKVGHVEYDAIRVSKAYCFVRTAFQQIAQRSDRLIHNVTSNLAEGFMSQMCKFTSGKRCSQSLSYGYSLRAMSAVFAYNYGSFWPAAIYEKFYKLTNNAWSEKYARSLAYRQRSRKQRKTKFVKTQIAPKQKCHDYGEDVCDTDIDKNVLLASVVSLIEQLQVSRLEQQTIQLCTIGQAFNDEWKYQRRNRITASFAGKVFKMRESTNSTSCIKSILYPVDLKNNDNVRRGIDFEPFAKKKYEEITGNFVTECGLFVSIENGILAASPDGIIDVHGIVEIKCPNVRPLQLCTRKDRILVQDKTDPSKIFLNRQHPYYYQIVMQMYVSDKLFCDFVVYFMDKESGNEDIWIERISRSESTDKLWIEMKLKLVKFFTEDLAPEIVHPRFVHKLPIRQPQYRKDAAASIELKKKSIPSNPSCKRPRLND